MSAATPTETPDGKRPAGTSRLVLRMGRALLEIGLPAHRVEAAMQIVARKLGLTGEFFSTPTAFIAALGDGARHKTLMVRAKPGQVNLAKLSDLSDVIEGLDADRLTVSQAADRVEAVLAARDGYAAPVTALAFAMYSASVACFFRGNWLELVAAAGVGLLTGLVGELAARTEALSRLFEPLAAALASFAAVLLGSRLPQVSPFLITLAGLIVLVPGLTVTVATRELASGQLVSGSSRFAGAMVVFLGLTFGVALGSQLGQMLVTLPPVVRAAPLPAALRYPALLVAALAFLVLFRARPRDVGWILAAGVLGLEGGELGRALLGPQLGPFVGGFAVGLGGNLFSRLLARPAAIIQFPGLILLVPGSIGFSGLTAMFRSDVVSGVQTAFMAVMVVVALTTGLLMSSLLLPPKRDF